MIPYLTFSVLAQTSPVTNPNPATPTTVLAAVIWLGGIIVGGLLLALRTLWRDNRGYQTRLNEVQDQFTREQQEQLRQSLTVTLDATSRLQASEKAIEAATTMMHQISGRGFSPEQMAEIGYLLRELREMRTVVGPRPPTTGGGQ